MKKNKKGSGGPGSGRKTGKRKVTTSNSSNKKPQTAFERLNSMIKQAEKKEAKEQFQKLPEWHKEYINNTKKYTVYETGKMPYDRRLTEDVPEDKIGKIDPIYSMLDSGIPIESIRNKYKIENNNKIRQMIKNTVESNFKNNEWKDKKKYKKILIEPSKQMSDYDKAHYMIQQQIVNNSGDPDLTLDSVKSVRMDFIKQFNELSNDIDNEDTRKELAKKYDESRKKLQESIQKLKEEKEKEHSNNLNKVTQLRNTSNLSKKEPKKYKYNDLLTNDLNLKLTRKGFLTAYNSKAKNEQESALLYVDTKNDNVTNIINQMKNKNKDITIGKNKWTSSIIDGNTIYEKTQ